MKIRLLIILTLLVVLPLFLLAWLGQRTIRGERAQVREGIQAQMAGRLAEVERGMAVTIAARERELSSILGAISPVAGVDPWRDPARQHRLIAATFVLDARGRMRHPPRDAASVSSDEMEFLRRTDGLWEDLFAMTIPSIEQRGAGEDQGWKTWYHGSGPRLLFWKRLAGGEVVGAEVPTSILIADLIGKLPAGFEGDDRARDGRVQWLDPQGRSVYSWGTEPTESSLLARIPAPHPFGAWSLELRAPDVVQSAGVAGRWAWWTGLFAVGGVLTWLATSLYREGTREMRSAAQRLTFVNQVSHELKTPLTNISMYAELAAARLVDDESAKPVREYLDVVVSESARLGRLINNVLTFSRHQRGALRPQLRPLKLDEELAAILQPFRPALADAGVQLDVALGSGATVVADADWLGQIMGNLLSNVEKYAVSGQWARISSEVPPASEAVVVTVADRGPGIADRFRERVFEPFFRASDKLTDGVAGTGLGLGLARELARAQGGDLILSPRAADVPARGCTFLLRLPLAPT
ncbi:MAG: sensor histidine kinase [Verrucomicrobiales bacterium]